MRELDVVVGGAGGGLVRPLQRRVAGGDRGAVCRCAQRRRVRRRGVDREGEGGRVAAGVAVGVDGADAPAVGAVGESGLGLRVGCDVGRGDPGEVAGAGALGRELDVVVGGAGGGLVRPLQRRVAGGDRGAVSRCAQRRRVRRRGVDREGEGGRVAAGVAVGVDGADAPAVGAVGESGLGLRVGCDVGRGDPGEVAGAGALGRELDVVVGGAGGGLVRPLQRRVAAADRGAVSRCAQRRRVRRRRVDRELERGRVAALVVAGVERADVPAVGAVRERADVGRVAADVDRRGAGEVAGRALGDDLQVVVRGAQPDSFDAGQRRRRVRGRGAVGRRGQRRRVRRRGVDRELERRAVAAGLPTASSALTFQQ